MVAKIRIDELPAYLINASDVLQMFIRRNVKELDVSDWCTEFEANVIVSVLNKGELTFVKEIRADENGLPFIYVYDNDCIRVTPVIIKLFDYLAINSKIVLSFIPFHSICWKTSSKICPFIYSLLFYNYQDLACLVFHKLDIRPVYHPISYHHFKQFFKDQIFWTFKKPY